MLSAMGIPMGADGWPALSAAGEVIFKEAGVEGVFMAGDAATGPSTIVAAMGGARKAVDAIMEREGIEAVAFTVPEGSTEEAIFNKKGMIPLTEVDSSDHRQVAAREATRCLECEHICTKCVDVCPNRANISIPVPGFKDPLQVLHLDAYCNECGNCGSFCSYESLPYKSKLTIFSLQEDFDSSTNTGFLLLEKEGGDDDVQVRFGGEEFRLSIDADSVVSGEAPEGAEDLCKVLSHVHREYRHLLGPVLP